MRWEEPKVSAGDLAFGTKATTNGRVSPDRSFRLRLTGPNVVVERRRRRTDF